MRRVEHEKRKLVLDKKLEVLEMKKQYYSRRGRIPGEE